MTWSRKDISTGRWVRDCAFRRKKSLPVELSCGHLITANIKLCGEGKFRDFRPSVLMTFYMRESNPTDYRVRCRQSGENVSLIGKPSFRYQVFQLLDVADSTRTVNKKQKPTLDIQRMKLCQFIQI
jgi:hypothetical protein